MINMSKTEDFTVKYKNENEWKNAKILGTTLNTETSQTGKVCDHLMRW